MKFFVSLLVIAAFLQGSFIPLNLCLLILVCRAYAVHSRENYYLALISGFLLGILTPVNLGFWPLVFLLSVLASHILRLVPVSGKLLTVIPVTLAIFLTVSGVENLVFKTPFIWWYILISSLLSLPLFIVIREWEERFTTKSGLKLRV